MHDVMFNVGFPCLTCFFQVKFLGFFPWNISLHSELSSPSHFVIYLAAETHTPGSGLGLWSGSLCSPGCVMGHLKESSAWGAGRGRSLGGWGRGRGLCSPRPLALQESWATLESHVTKPLSP